MKVFINSPKIFSPESKWHLKTANVLIENGVIAYIGNEIKKADTEVEGKGRWLSPGWFDTWAHFCDPGFENKEDQFSGRKAAAAGGFTSVAVLPNTHPVISTKNDIAYLKRANDDHLTAVYPYAAVTTGNNGDDLTEMIDLFESGAIAFTDGESPIKDSETVVKVLQYLTKMDALLIQKPIDVSLAAGGTLHEGIKSTELGLKGIPALAEELIIQRDLSLLKYAGGRLHFSTISTSGAVVKIKNAKKSGLDVTCSVSALQLLFSDLDIEDFDSNYKVMPPFRSERHNKAMIKGLNEGTIDVICSAHIPQDTESKKLEFDLADFGVTGLQTVAPALAKLSEWVPMEVLLEKVSTSPRNLLGLDVPLIEVGEKAELTLFDPKMKWTFDAESNFSKSDNSPLFGKELVGKAVAVLRGNIYQQN